MMEQAAALPLLKPAMAGLIGRIAIGQIRPSGSGAQNPQHPVEHLARIAPRPSSPIGPPLRPEEGTEQRPLGVGERHTADVRRFP